MLIIVYLNYSLLASVSLKVNGFLRQSAFDRRREPKGVRKNFFLNMVFIRDLGSGIWDPASGRQARMKRISCFPNMELRDERILLTQSEQAF